MEENVTRALVIGVSLFVIVVTISLLMIYFNIARQIATEANSRMDIAEAYDDIVTKREKTSAYLTGVEIRQLIRQYAGDESVEINIYSISNREIEAALEGATYKDGSFVWIYGEPEYVPAKDYYIETLLVKNMYSNINNNWLSGTGNNISEAYLSIIDPGWEKNWVTKEIKTEDGKEIIELKLSLDDRAGIHH